MYKQDLALNNLQEFIYHETQPTNQPYSIAIIYKSDPKSLKLI